LRTGQNEDKGILITSDRSPPNGHLPTRKNRCFARKLETLQAVVEVYVDAYNQFGRAKHIYQLKHEKGEPPFSALDFL